MSNITITKTKVLMLVAMLMGTCNSFAQLSDEQLKNEINKVKKSNAYLYGEANADTEEEAHAIAEEILYNEINQWAAKKKKLQGGELVVNNKKELQTYISVPRGNMVRAFVYVKKSDITASHHAEIIQTTPVTTEQPARQSTVTRIYPQAVEKISACTEYSQLEPQLEAERQAGRIRHYALYGKLANPDPYYLIIFNKAGKVMAVLTQGPSRVNVKTGQPDGVANYSGCGAIGFSVNE